jgi:hypothetical protein
MFRWTLSTGAAMLLAACASSPAANTEPPPAAVTAAPPLAAGALVVVEGNAETGVSPLFMLTGSSYKVEWVMTANAAGCDFYLFLARNVNGVTVKDVRVGIMPAARDYSGSTEWTGVAAGTYVLQEDRSGALNCTGPWNATLTPHQPGG